VTVKDAGHKKGIRCLTVDNLVIASTDAAARGAAGRKSARTRKSLVPNNYGSSS
jgi:hypothetical protein